MKNIVIKGNTVDLTRDFLVSDREVLEEVVQRIMGVKKECRGMPYAFLFPDCQEWEGSVILRMVKSKVFVPEASYSSDALLDMLGKRCEVGTKPPTDGVITCVKYDSNKRGYILYLEKSDRYRVFYDTSAVVKSDAKNKDRKS